MLWSYKHRVAKRREKTRTIQNVQRKMHEYQPDGNRSTGEWTEEMIVWWSPEDADKLLFKVSINGYGARWNEINDILDPSHPMRDHRSVKIVSKCTVFGISFSYDPAARSFSRLLNGVLAPSLAIELMTASVTDGCGGWVSGKAGLPGGAYTRTCHLQTTSRVPRSFPGLAGCPSGWYTDLESPLNVQTRLRREFHSQACCQLRLL